MFFLKFSVFTAFLLLFAVGCASSGTGNGIVYAPSKTDAETMDARTTELVRTIAPCAVRGLFFEADRLPERYFSAPALFPERVTALGFNRLYLMLDTPEALKLDGLPALLEATAAAGIPVEAVLPESGYVLGRQGNALRRTLMSANGVTLEEMLRKIRKFETETFRFAGVTLLVQPHLFTRTNIHRPKSLVFAWDEKTFGPGLDNDNLMKVTLDKAAGFAARLAPTPLSIGMPDFYEELVMEGKLSCGSVADFGKIASDIIILNSGNKPSELLDTVRNELANAAPGSLLVAVTLANHTSVTSGALRRRNWTDYIRSLGNAVTEWKNRPAFGGVVLGPLAQIETLLQEK